MANIINCAERERVDLVPLCPPCQVLLKAVFGRTTEYNEITIGKLKADNHCEIVKEIDDMAAEEARRQEAFDNSVPSGNRP